MWQRMNILKIIAATIQKWISFYTKNTPMKTQLFILLFFALIEAGIAQEQLKKSTITVKQSESGITDSANYELLIIDPGFESWLISEAKPMGYHSQTYLENWNRQYVAEWNNRYSAGQNMDVIESYVDYDYNTNYGLEVNYKLYNYFIYAEKKYNLQLLNRVGN